MEKIVLASNNKHKVKEFKDILKNKEIITLEDIEFYDDVEETGTTFFENALIKAKTIHKFLNEKNLKYDIIADDSGLCVNSLNGAPGIYSARYSGKHGDAAANRKKLLEEMLDKEDRTAFFVCNIVLYHPDNTYLNFEGKTFGKITTEEIGDKSFGFDCLFFSDDLEKTFGEAEKEEKNKVSHRGRAIQKLLEAYNK